MFLKLLEVNKLVKFALEKVFDNRGMEMRIVWRSEAGAVRVLASAASGLATRPGEQIRFGAIYR